MMQPGMVNPNNGNASFASAFPHLCFGNSLEIVLDQLKFPKAFDKWIPTDYNNFIFQERSALHDDYFCCLL